MCIKHSYETKLFTDDNGLTAQVLLALNLIIKYFHFITLSNIAHSKINNTVPPIINKAPIAVFKVNVSPRNNTDNTMVSDTLSLSTGATCDTLPICNALK